MEGRNAGWAGAGQGCTLADTPPWGPSRPSGLPNPAPSPGPTWLFPAAPGHWGTGRQVAPGTDSLWSWAGQGAMPGPVSPSVRWGRQRGRCRARECPPGGRDDAPRPASEGAHAQAASCLPSLSTRPTFRVNAVAVLGRRPRPHGWNMLVPGFEPEWRKGLPGLARDRGCLTLRRPQGTPRSELRAPQPTPLRGVLSILA